MNNLQFTKVDTIIGIPYAVANNMVGLCVL